MSESTVVGFTVNEDIEEIIGVKGRFTVDRLMRGLPTNSARLLAKHLALTQSQGIKLLKMGKKTFEKRDISGVLTVEESDRVVRFARLLALAIQMLGDGRAAAMWLKTPALALGNETPLFHAATEMGARNVERLVGRIEHGIPT